MNGKIILANKIINNLWRKIKFYLNFKKIN
jgi:hypothetical protein